MFPDWTWIVGFLIGSAIGSFLNVVIYRLPLGMSLSNPKHSFCPNCKNQLRWMDLFPLFSWLVLGGKCRQCKVKVPPRYFFVELLTASLWGGIWFQYLCASNEPAKAIAYLLAASALVAVIYIDLRWFIIPDTVNAWIFAFGLGLNAYTLATGGKDAWMWGIPSAIAGALVGWGVLWGITLLGRLLFGKDAMGHGDIKLARGIGAVLLPLGAGISFAMAVVLGAVLGILQVVLRKKIEKGTSEKLENDDEEDAYEPESIGSIFKCGLGYLLLFDIVGLFIPRFYQNWFGEDPYAAEDPEDEWVPSFSTIPFGPYLAAGALIVMIFQSQVLRWVQSYLNWISGT